MFIRNTNQQNPRRHHHFFLRRQTCKGESPTEAGKGLVLLCLSIRVYLFLRLALSELCIYVQYVLQS